MSNSNTEIHSFTFTGSLVADIVNYIGLGTKLETLRASIAEALQNEIKASGVSVALAAKQLRADLKEAGISKQDASKALLSLGIRERAASVKKTEDAAEKAEALRPLIEELVAAAKAGASDLADAVAALNRAHKSLAAEIKARSASAE